VTNVTRCQSCALEDASARYYSDLDAEVHALKVCRYGPGLA